SWRVYQFHHLGSIFNVVASSMARTIRSLSGAVNPCKQKNAKNLSSALQSRLSLLAKGFSGAIRA
ncbi:hypothetical protein, partial [Pseudomonas asplenii]|uniref:hypothetical protein n=1 Tax=Pseudomonas asplenii TaxID=53407 RepID=UPI001E35CDA9